MALGKREAPVEASDSLTAVLARLGKELQDIAGDREEREERLKQLDDLLGKLNVKDYGSLADHPVVQRLVELRSEQMAAARPDDPPGTIYNRGKVNEFKKVWQWSDLARLNIPVVTFIPDRTLPVTWNGLSTAMIADEPWTGYNVFYNVYLDSKAADKFAKKHAQFLFRQEGVVPEPAMLTPEALRVRGWGSRGHVIFGGGVIARDNRSPEGAAAAAGAESGGGGKEGQGAA